MHTRFDHEQAGRGNANGRIDVVDLAGRLDDFGYLDRLVDGGATLDQLVTADSNTQCHLTANHLSNSADDIDQQPCPIRQRSAILIDPFVGCR